MRAGLFMLFFSAACALPAAAPAWVDITWMSISNMYYELGSKYILTDGYFTRIPQSEFFGGGEASPALTSRSFRTLRPSPA